MILHIDMDAFYASVEQLDYPEYKGKCIIVGGSSSRGVVSAASYEARKCGVHSAMPIFQAKQKCPHGIFVRPRIKRYKEISDSVMSLLKDFSPIVEQVSIDEAYMDISGTERLLGPPEQVGALIKKRIQENISLTCSVGIAPVRFLAKIASDLEKPDGLTIIPQDEIETFIASLPIRKVPGVGKVTFDQLNLLGIKYLGDIKKHSVELLIKRLGKYGKRLLELSNGNDSTAITPDVGHKSVSTEHTLSEDTQDKFYLNKFLLKHSIEVAKELRKLDVCAKTITLKIKHTDFKLVTRSITISAPTHSSDKIYREASQLLAKYHLDKKVRLIGVGASNFAESGSPVQMDIFESSKKKNNNWEKIDKALDSISEKFGKKAVKRAGSDIEKNDK